MPVPDAASPSPPGARTSLGERVWLRPRAAIPPGCAKGAIAGVRLATLIAGGLVAAGPALLAGCSQPDAFAPACPQLAMLPDGADLIRYAGAGRDLTDLVLDAHLAAVPAACHWANDAHTKVEAKLQVAMSLGRGPAMGGRTIDVPYFVAVTEGDAVLDKQVYAARAEFPSNADRVTVSSPEVSMVFPVTHEKSAAAYKIIVSFQLTPEELEQNRARGSAR